MTEYGQLIASNFCLAFINPIPISPSSILCVCSSTLQKRTKDIAHNIEMEEAVVRRSTRVRAPLHENPASAFLRYVNKWKED